MPHDRGMLTGLVASNSEIRRGHYLMSLHLPASFETPYPGQFVLIRLKGRKDILLGRPFSISGFDRDADRARIEILYRVAGKATRLFATLGAGEALDILGPLGRSFDVPGGVSHLILVSGGIGIAPLRYLMAWVREGHAGHAPRIDLFMGARTRDDLCALDTVGPLCDELRVCTDDCSMGHPGVVTEPLEACLPSYPSRGSLICACGPAAMLRRLSELLAPHAIPCQVSLEERMACGLGACLGCAVAVRGQGGEKQYQRVCREGPVFSLQDILWE